MKRYDSLRDQAKKFYEAGYSYNKIARMIRISRPMTVFEWKKKYGWERKAPIRFSSADEQVEIWKEIENRALDFIRNYVFKSVLEALKVFEKADYYIKEANLNAPKEKPDNGDKFLTLLKKYDED